MESDSDVKITIYNEGVGLIVTKEKSGATGVNTINDIDALNWANGVYLYKIRAQNRLTGSVEEIIKKFILMR